MTETIIISDFDGTITNTDLADKFIRYFEGEEVIKQLENALNNRRIDLIEFMSYICQCITHEMKNIKYNHDVYKLVDILVKEYNIHVDQDIFTLRKLCQSKKIEFKILSGGFKKFILYILNQNVQPTERITEDILISHDFECLNNEYYKFKSNTEIIPKGKYIETKYPRDEYNVIFMGDGVSDFSVVQNCSLVFAKENSILAEKCLKEKISFIPFKTFDEIILYITKHGYI